MNALTSFNSDRVLAWGNKKNNQELFKTSPNMGMFPQSRQNKHP